MRATFFSSFLYKFFTMLVVLSMTLVALPVMPVHAATLTVNSLGDTLNNADGVCTLREAITNANADAGTWTNCAGIGYGNDTITFSVSGTLTLTSSLPTITDTDGLTINGGNAITISGNNAYRIISVNAGGTGATFQNITLSNAALNGNGAAINNMGNLTITNVTFSNNRGTDPTNNGGAVYHSTGSLSITNSTFTSNYTGNDGGAVYVASGTGTMSISGSTFNTQNNATIDDGAAVYLSTGTLQINGTTFSSNATSNGGGGAIFQAGGALTLGNTSANTFSGNTASTGGGALYLNGGTLTVNNNSFTNNSSPAAGGAIYHSAGTLLSVTNSTFSNNAATNGDGGAIMIATNTSSTSISASTFTSNSAGDDAGAIYNNGTPFTITTSTFQTNSAGTLAGGTADGGAIRNSNTATNSKVTLSSFVNNRINMAANQFIEGAAIANDGTLVIANVTFSGNSLSKTTAGAGNALGGAIYSNGTTTVHNATFSANSASESGTGMADGGALYNNAGTLSVANSIVAGSTENGAAGSCGGTIANGGNNVDFNGGGCGFTITANPNLGAPTGSPVYFPLNANSSAIDSGSNAICATANTTNNQSQNGVTRPKDGNNDGTSTCDIGSYEAADSAPTVVSITRLNPSPTNLPSVQFLVTFSETVTGGAASNLTLTTTGSLNAVAISNVSAGPGTTRTVTVNTGSGTGTLRLDVVNSTGIADGGGNALNNIPYTSGEVYTVDNGVPTVTIDQASAQTDPTNTAPINFTVVFSEDVTGFTAADVTLSSGTAVVTGGPSTYNVAVSGMSEGTITASIPANAAADAVGNNSTASTSGDNSVMYDVTAPDTTITANPSDPSADPDPVFSFSGDDGSGSGIGSFECQVDGGGFSGCTSGSSFGVLGEGAHTFDVRAVDNAGNNDSTPASYAWTIDVTGPIVTIDQAGSQSDPTNQSPIEFVVEFSEPVSGFDSSDVTLSGTAGSSSATVAEISPNDGTTYSVTVSGMTGDGTVIAEIPADAALDSSNNGNIASVSSDNEVTYNTGAPDTTIDSHPTNPSNSPSAAFTFSSPDADGTGFECKLDSGTFDVCNSPMDYASLTAGSHTFTVRAIDDAGNVDPSPASYTWQIDLDYPTVSSSKPAANATINTGSTQLTVTFSEDVKHDGSSNAADNKVNYLLVEEGEDNSFDTVSCANGLVPDDTLIAINSVMYTNNGGSGPFVATISVNSLTAGTYRLFVCGTTSIQDLVNNKLNNGANDTIINFYAHHTGKGGGSSDKKSTTSTSGLQIPNTGFAHGTITSLAVQPAEKAYSSTDLWLEIPRLGMKMSIVGVPQTEDGWDVSWLGKDAGWLNGSAYPTWDGNSVLTGHVWDALNQPGPFAGLKQLNYGDQIKIHTFGQIYIYEVRESQTVLPTSTSAVFKHEEKSWITLITCEDYREKSQTYSYRRLVRAVLIKVTSEE